MRDLLPAGRTPLPTEYRSVPPAPAPSFASWNRNDVILYDIERGHENNFGPGRSPAFTRDGRYLYWTAPDPATGDGRLGVLEVATLQLRWLGEALGARGDYQAGYVQAQVRGGRFERVSLEDGSRSPWQPQPDAGHAPLLAEYGGWRLEGLAGNGWQYGFGQYRLSDASGSLAALEFEVWQVALLPDGALIVATSPTDRQPQGGEIRGWTAASDIFEFDPATGTAAFIASVRATEYLFPFAASERFVVWTDDFCNVTTPSGSNGRTRVYDRQTRALTELDQAYYIDGITPRGELAIGAFGADALLDLETLEYTVVFPSEDRVWSPDYRYAAVGQTGGHGGYCGGE